MIHAAARRTLLGWLTGALLLAYATGCANQSGTATEPTSAPAADSRPGPVALQYMQAIARGDLKAAIPLVATSQRAMLEAVALGQGPDTLPKITGEVSIGDVAEKGDNATVSFLGKLCRSGAVTDGSRLTPGTDCVENHDPKTKSPIFLVHLAREAAVGWKVVLNFAAAARPGRSG